MIAGGYDEDSPPEWVMSHIKAMQLNPFLEVVAVVDVDLTKAKKFSKRWSVPRAYQSIKECLEKEKPEWVSICSPNALHVEQVEMAVAAGSKVILCEKPIAMNVIDTKKLIDLVKKKNVFLTVNYLRRWDVKLQKIVREIQEQKWGRLLSGQVHYSKGVLHYSSHAINWFQSFLEGAPQVQVNQKKDFAIEGDIISDFTLTWKNSGPIEFIGYDYQVKNVFDIELIFEKGKISLPGGGYEVNAEKGTITSAMKEVIENVVDSYREKSKLPLSLEDVLKTMQICERVKEQTCKL